VNLDGTGLEQVTYNETFDGFPMFSPDGKKLVFASNRHDTNGTDTNIFIADWQN
jgi:Tol biopolymer transport system component